MIETWRERYELQNIAGVRGRERGQEGGRESEREGGREGRREEWNSSNKE